MGAHGTFGRGVGSPTGASGSGAGGGQPKRMNLEKLKEAEEYRIKANKQLKVSGGGLA